MRTHLLGPEDLETIHSFHRLIHRTLKPKGTLYLRSRTYFRRILEGQGRIIAASSGDELVGYVTLRFPGTSPDNYGRDVGLPKGELQSVGQLDGGAVHPRARQMGLYQHLLVRRVRLARILGYHHLTAVVSPLNPPSLSSQLQLGLRVVGIKVDQDGPNFLLHADSRARSMEPERPAARVLIGDFEAHRAALDQGLVGIRLERARESHTLIYGHNRSRAVSSPSE